MKDVLFRLPIPDKLIRPAALKPQDKDRLEKSKEPEKKK
jgi:stage V sporulation protein AF